MRRFSSGGVIAIALAALSTQGNAQTKPDTRTDPNVIALIGQAQASEASRDEPVEMTDAQRGAALWRVVTPPADKPVRLNVGTSRTNLPPLRDELIVLLNGLNDSTLALREAASRVLEDPLRISKSDLLSMAHRARNPEQRNRVLREHRRRFFETQRAAIGVRFPQANREQDVELRIEEMYDFPARQQGVLQIGDLILSIGGVSMVDPETGQVDIRQMQTSILSYDADSVAQMVVRRRVPQGMYVGFGRQGVGVYQLDQSLLLDVPLGMWTKLPGNRGPGADIVGAAWRIRALRDGLPLGAMLQYGENAARPSEHARNSANIKGHSIHDVLPQDIFRDERVSNFDVSPLQKKRFASQKKKLLQQQLRVQAIAQNRRGQQRGIVRLGGERRWSGLGRDPDGNRATGITVIERRGSTEIHHTEGKGSNLDLARQIAEVRAAARAARRTARQASTHEARDTAEARAEALDVQAAVLTQSLALVQSAEAVEETPGE